MRAILIAALTAGVLAASLEAQAAARKPGPEQARIGNDNAGGEIRRECRRS
jgi:hypothetical protein